MTEKSMKKTTRIALVGVLVALAFLFSYLESLLPSIGIPGVKPGLANLVVVVALYLLSPGVALGISLTRILLAGFTFGTLTMALYSLAGGLTSFLVMFLAQKSGKFSPVGVSMAGGVSHNIGQLAVAAVATGTPAVAWYLPVLLTAGLVTGALLGWIAGLVLPSLGKIAPKT